jgi:hypothetical protein
VQLSPFVDLTNVHQWEQNAAATLAAFFSENLPAANKSYSEDNLRQYLRAILNSVAK